MRYRTGIAVLLVGLSAAACATSDPGVRATESRVAAAEVPLMGEEEQPVTSVDYPIEPGIIDFGSTKPEQPYDGFLIAAFKDIQQYWMDEFQPVYGGAWEPLAGGIFAAYPDRGESIPGCGTDSTSYEDVAGNAFYCIAGDFMAYDDADLIPTLVGELGQAAVGVVLAHEFGHAVQARTNNWTQPVLLKEQQADCFAGAWTAHVARGESDSITFTDTDVRGGVIAMIKVRDPQVGAPLDPDAHGTGFDRVGAFQDGFNGGAARCATFFDENRVASLINIPFTEEDFETQGNLPFNEVPIEIPADLDRFWTTLLQGSTTAFVPPTVGAYTSEGPFPTCDGVDPSAYPSNVVYCSNTNQILYDTDFALQLYNATLLVDNAILGDMAFGFMLAQAYGEAVQNALGTGLTGEARVLLNDCLTGAWVRDIVPPLPADRPSLQLSAGDLDEALITAILRGDNTTDANVVGSAFEKIEAFRAGVLGGLEACQARV